MSTSNPIIQCNVTEIVHCIIVDPVCILLITGSGIFREECLKGLEFEGASINIFYIGVLESRFKSRGINVLIHLLV